MIVVLMAMCLIFLIHAVVKRNWHSIVGIIIPIVVYAACSHGFFTVMEKKYDVVTDNGLGKITWIAMGLQGDEYGNRLPDEPSWVTGSVNPGWYNGYPWGWKTDYDPEVAAADSKESIKRFLDKICSKPNVCPFDSLRKNRRLFGLTPLMKRWSMAIGPWCQRTIAPLPCPIVP